MKGTVRSVIYRWPLTQCQPPSLFLGLVLLYQTILSVTEYQLKLEDWFIGVIIDTVISLISKSNESVVLPPILVICSDLSAHLGGTMAEPYQKKRARPDHLYDAGKVIQIVLRHEVSGHCIGG